MEDTTVIIGANIIFWLIIYIIIESKNRQNKQ
nr:MAG TPA: holin family protein [Crassvirales sp.]